MATARFPFRPPVVKASRQGTHGRTVADYAVGKLPGPAAGPICLIERAVGVERD